MSAEDKQAPKHVLLSFRFGVSKLWILFRFFRERLVCSVKYEVRGVVLNWFRCEIFDRELWFEKKRLVV